MAYAFQGQGKRLRIWVIALFTALVLLHVSRELWFHLVFRDDTLASVGTYLLWELSGFVVPALFTALRNVYPLLGGSAALALIELLETYGTLSNPSHVPMPGIGVGWILVPTLITVVFLSGAAVSNYLIRPWLQRTS